MEQYEAYKYSSKEWALWGKTCKCPIVFGTKKRMQELAKELNKKEREGR